VLPSALPASSSNRRRSSAVIGLRLGLGRISHIADVGPRRPPTEAARRSSGIKPGQHRGGLFVVLRGAKHLAGSGIHVMYLAAGEALDRGIGRIALRWIVRRPTLDAEALVRASEKEGYHLI
jgi:hypothetical protein